MSEVELSKQITPPLTQQQRLQLAMDLMHYELTAHELRKVAQVVKEMDTYGKMPLNAWTTAIRDGGTMLELIEAQAKIMAERMIEKRREQYRKIHFSDEALMREGLKELSVAYAVRWEEEKERMKKLLKARIRRASAFVRSAPEDVQMEVADIAVSKGILQLDSTWKTILPYVVPKMLTEVEGIMQRL